MIIEFLTMFVISIIFIGLILGLLLLTNYTSYKTEQDKKNLDELALRIAKQITNKRKSLL